MPPAQNVQLLLDALSDLLPLRTPRAGAGLPSLTGLPPISPPPTGHSFMSPSIQKSFSRRQMTPLTPEIRLLGTCASGGGRLDGAQHDGTGQPSPSGGPQGGGHAARAAPSARSQPRPPPPPRPITRPLLEMCSRNKKEKLYIYVYIHIYVYTYTHTYIYVYVYLYIHG